MNNAASGIEFVDTGIDLDEFDPAKSISLEQALKDGLLRVSRPVPGILLPAVLVGGEWRTMPDWIAISNETLIECFAEAPLTPGLPRRSAS